MGDEVRIQSIVTNIIENALRYCDKDGEISVIWFTDAAGGHLSIRDNGIGMEEKHLERVTERFYRIDKGRSRKMGGTGLGLAISRQELEETGGQIHCESTSDQGTVFTMILPARLDAEADPGQTVMQ